ncbi:hypothetical protein lbkm_2523 [Lachnospiraceae bacterium KM106-2]|nr:hypothetical protein lbkm_2523 [Lachnospiraceae bacterium KM106-2]
MKEKIIHTLQLALFLAIVAAIFLGGRHLLYYGGNSYDFTTNKILIYRGNPIYSELVAEITDQKEIKKLINMVGDWRFTRKVWDDQVTDDSNGIFVRFNDQVTISMKEGRSHGCIGKNAKDQKLIYLPKDFWQYIIDYLKEED